MSDNKLEHVSGAIKHAADAGIWGSVTASWIMSLAPLLNFAIIILALVWGYFRVIDIKLAIKLKKLKIRRHEDN